MHRASILLTGLLAIAGASFAQNARRADRIATDVIPAGVRIPVRLDQTIDVRIPSDGRVFTGSVTEDVLSQSGTVMIPRGARAELIVQNLGEREGTIDLESVEFGGKRYM